MNDEINLLLNYISFASFYDSVDNFKLKDSKTDNSIVRIPNEIIHLKSYDYFCDLVKNNKVNLKTYNNYNYYKNHIIKVNSSNTDKCIKLIVAVIIYIEHLELNSNTFNNLNEVINHTNEQFNGCDMNVLTVLDEYSTDAIKLIEWMNNYVY